MSAVILILDLCHKLLYLPEHQFIFHLVNLLAHHQFQPSLHLLFSMGCRGSKTLSSKHEGFENNEKEPCPRSGTDVMTGAVAPQPHQVPIGRIPAPAPAPSSQPQPSSAWVCEVHRYYRCPPPPLPSSLQGWTQQATVETLNPVQQVQWNGERVSEAPATPPHVTSSNNNNLNQSGV